MAETRKLKEEAVISVSSNDIEGREDLRAALVKCAGGDRQIVGAEYERIGRILHSNATRLGLEETTHQISVFANRMACEVLSDEEREDRYPGGCWVETRYDSCPPFRKKISGKTSSGGEVRSLEKQRIVMTQIFATVLSRDPQFGGGAKALLHHADTHDLFPESDWLGES
jgi:hypothetical protein